ncbi:hypothetical protein CRE_30429 [Caenorhabditis remanei]|uniref:Uncharacterized protein n=1 Tax=Caenorhabditis remanei TaxID=31234 RepID=E3NAI0_CAERE|nr:hypothetical protein CRE_30429 [Caenorhabditis remanei]
MKLLLVFIGILAMTIHHVSSAISDKKSISNKEEYLKSFNDLRREYAKKSRIPNMHKLVWDDYMETQVQMNDLSEYGKTMRVSRRDGNDADKEWRHKMVYDYYWADSTRETMIKQSIDHHMAGLEDLTPHQKRIGCAPYNYSAVLDGENIITETMCFLAPEGTFASWNRTRGDAGSKCTDGYENDDGLCSPVAKSEKVTDGGSLENSQNGTATNSSGINEKTYGIRLVFLLFVILTMF